MNKTLSIFLTLILSTTILPAFIQRTSEIEQTTSKDLGVEPLFQHKDTIMLDLDGSPLRARAHGYGTFGETGVGSNWDSCKNYIVGSEFQATGSGIPSQITALIDISGAGFVCLMIYDTIGDYNLVAYTEEDWLLSDQWVSLDIDWYGEQIVQGNWYYLCIWGGWGGVEATDDIKFNFDPTGGAGNGVYRALTFDYPNIPDPLYADGDRETWQISIYSTFYLRARGDVNGDGIVDIFDVVLASLAFGSIPGDSNWNQAADLNNDDVVDIFDIVLLANNFGKTA